MLVTLEARASLPTTFMRIFGHDTMQVAARTEITREMTGLEVALVLDVTGSMFDAVSATRRDAEDRRAGDAAHELMETLFGDNDTSRRSLDGHRAVLADGQHRHRAGRTGWPTDDDQNRLGQLRRLEPRQLASHTSRDGQARPLLLANGPNVSTRTNP